VGWAEGFEPSATGTTIRRSTKLSYAHRNERFHRIRPGKSAAICAIVAAKPSAPNHPPYSPAAFHNPSTRRFTSSDMRMTPGHGRVKPSPGHLRVASIPIFEP
jgi:hypothetical protein